MKALRRGVQRMEKDLQELQSLADRGIGASDSALCNGQCRALKMLLSDMVSLASHWKTFFAPHFTADTEKLLNALKGALQDAVTLLTEYSTKPWQSRALVSQENTLGFQYVAENVGRYVDMINSYLLSVAEDRDHVQELVDKSRSDRALLQRYLREMANRDRIDLIEKAEDVLRKSSSVFSKTAKARCAKLARKLQSKGSSDMFNIEKEELEISRRDDIGEGTFGKVFKGKWMDLPVAVKESPCDDIHFPKEVGIMSGLQPHPNIVQFLGAAESRDKRFLVMELMKMDLKRFLREKVSQLPLLDKVDIMLQIATGIYFLHLNDICHRDIKPQNLLVNPDPVLRVKVADFGRSKDRFQSLGVNTNRAGSYAYMAPEVMKSERYSRKADVFSFAIVCGEILRGHLQVRNIHPSELHQNLVKGERPDIDDCPNVKLRNLVERCWLLRPEHRPDFEEIHTVLWEVKRELLTGGLQVPSSISTEQESMISVPSRLFSSSPDEEVSLDSSRTSSSSATSSAPIPAGVHDLQLTGSNQVGSTLAASWKNNNRATRGFRIQWGKYTTPESQEPEWLHEPVLTTSTGDGRVLSPHDYGARMCLRVIPLSKDPLTDETMFRVSPTPVTLDPISQVKLEKHLADGHADFNVNIDGRPLCKLQLYRSGFNLWWSRGKNLREAYSPGCAEASKEDLKCCFVNSTSKGVKRFKLLFDDEHKRNRAVVIMIKQWNSLQR